METTILALTLCLVMSSFAKMASDPIPLSMMDQSVDDMYDGCSEAMGKKVESTYFPTELKSNELFKDAWENEEKTAQKKYDKSDKKLTKEQIQALCVYTGGKPKVYGPFNTAVRDGVKKYRTNAFEYHALHYWLTTALQALNKNKQCHTTYRRNNITFTGELNQEMRFGYFASSSIKTNLTWFGKETCFHIKTCLGAYIEEYSCYKNQDEVLIPPYEKFKIIKIVKGSYKKLTNCTNIFVLKKTGSKSNLNCTAVPEQVFSEF